MSARKRSRSSRRVAIVLFLVAVCAGWAVFAWNEGLGDASPDAKHPLEQPPSPSSASEDYTEITLAAAGDIMFHDTELKSGYDKTTKRYDFRSFFADVKPILSAADLAIANFETTTGGLEAMPYMGYPRFNSPDETIDAVRDAGFDVLTTANNHALDTGSQGIVRTLEQIHKRGIDTVGTYAKRPDTRVLMKDVQGIKLAFLSYTESTNGLENTLTPEELDTMINVVDERKIKEDIAYAKAQKADLIIAVMHWGNEYEREPAARQQNLAKQLVGEGVDLILGSHPHVIQKSERSSAGGHEGFVIYSMGNFISNQRLETLDNAYTEDGIILNFRIRKNKASNETTIRKVDYVPTWVYRDKEQGQSTYAYKILPITDFLENDELSAAYKQRMQRSYQDTMAQMDGGSSDER
ncbi:CapA family protein [Cohnella sp. REN36]|uniref:CapA family protein n=1 Tax=Cohnella sp. REN36 TaxID=2887347 RepID=UPI001D1342CD|nr:CapA family protein [Cohnella sp. REN36]MCC3373658.1 CapA family protein [Cohnella sp. REN36]